MLEIRATVIGGGIVGCAVAAELAGRGVETVLLEKEGDVARGTTSRNSEVAHGGMYYPAGTRKALHCVRGRRMLKQLCETANVGYRECGKLIVAVEEAERSRLEELYELGRANGVEDLELLGTADVARLEPDIRARAALWSPRTGILDAEGATRALADRARARGAQVLPGAAVTGLQPDGSGWLVTVEAADGRREGWTHRSAVVVNAAGLFADRVAELSGADVDALGWRQVLSKGNYFRIDPRHAGRVRHLVYPIPPADGSTLGTHVCLDLAGQLRLGPDYEALSPRDPQGLLDETWDYRVDPARGEEFLRDAGRFLPWLEPDDLGPDQCGIRPKLTLAGFRDFVVAREEGERAGLIQLIGIDSPGLTSAPSLAEEVADLAAPILE